MTGRNIDQHRAVLELRKGSRTTPVDKRRTGRTTQNNEWKREQER